MEKEKNQLLKQLGAHIQQLRKEKGLSQTQLAHRIDKDQQSIQKLESGRFNPTYYYLYEIARGLNIPLKELFDFELPSKENPK